MESPNIVKMDSKGRILIPVHLRDTMSIEHGTEMIIVPDGEKKHFKILPISKNRTAEIKILLQNSPGTFASVADALSANAFGILVSESRRIGEELTEWKIIVETAGTGGMETLKDIVSQLDGVRNLDIIRK